MNRLFALNSCWLLLTLLTNLNSVSAQQFPYTAYVTGDQTYVRSGPGQRYYPTGKFQPGFAVEVYRHDKQGWCAIRPPAGSFSWIPSHQVRAQGANIVEVIGERVVTRVGSTLSPNRSAVQVLLPQGERLELLAASESDDPRWLRVAAPAGEFRWIAADALSLEPPLEAARPKPSEANESGWSRQSKQQHATPHDEPTEFDHLEARQTAAQPGLKFGVPIEVAAQTAAPMDPNAMQVVVGSPAELQLAQFQAQLSQAAPSSLLNDGNAIALPSAASTSSSQPRVRFDGLTPPQPITVGSVQELELRISQTVVQPPKQWQLEPLEAAANALMTATTTPSVRAQLREVLERISRFQAVQQRYNHPTTPKLEARTPLASTTVAGGEAPSFTGQTSEVRQRIKQDLQTTSDPFDSGETTTGEEPLYAATGMLKPVISERAEAPQYALVDEQGKVVSFVTPTPDLNLKPYLGRRIGVHGTRGYMPEYRRAHVTAGRVTPIEGTIRR